MGSVAGAEGHAIPKPALPSRPLVLSTCAIPLANCLPGSAHTGPHLEVKVTFYCHLPTVAFLSLLPAYPIYTLLLLWWVRK